jgi:hypothetical protein
MKNKYIKTFALAIAILTSQMTYAQCNIPITYIQQTTCQGTSYSFNGINADTAGTYNDTIQVAGGCDSIISLQLLPIVYTNFYDTICQGGSYNFFGTTLTTAGVYGDTLFYGSYFCDSVVLLNLAIRPSQNDTFRISDTYCGGGFGGGGGGGYNFYGTIERNSGIYVHTASLPSGSVCADSVVILNLTVGNTGQPGPPAAVTSCGASYSFYGQTLTANGNYSDTLISSTGCDSIISIRLTLNGQYYEPAATVATLCPGGTYIWRGMAYTQPSPGGGFGGGGYKDTVIASTGCDTIYTLTLRQGNAAPTINVADSFCAGSSYTYSGVIFSSAGRDTVILPSTAGCDTTVILTLTYKAAPSYTLVDSFCEGSTYTYRGHSYTVAGQSFFTVPAPAGCDSIIHVDLSYKAAPTVAITDSFCQGTSYTYRGATFSTAGLHAVTLPAPSGCDTVVNLTLSYTTPLARTIADTICQGATYIYGTDTFTTRGMHVFTVTTPGSCDSLITLDLTVSRSPRLFVTDSFCTGTTYYYHGDSFTTAGIYNTMVPAPAGCDTAVTLNLRNKVSPATPVISGTGSILVVNPVAASYQWYLDGAALQGDTSQTLSITQSGVYAVITQGTSSCAAMSANDTVTNVGINEVSGSDLFTIYPNPNNGKFTIETAQYAGASITIYDVLGREVYHKALLSGKESIDMSSTLNGTYYLAMKNQQFTRYAHFVIAQ